MTLKDRIKQEKDASASGKDATRQAVWSICEEENFLKPKEEMIEQIENNELIHLLPKNYYVGQVIDTEKFESLSNNTEFLNRRIRAYVRKITILYNIKTKERANKIKVLMVEVNTHSINRKEIPKLVNAIQRGILCKTIIIFYANDRDYCNYKVVVPFCHMGANNKIMVLDSFEETRWCHKFDLERIFKNAKDLIQNGEIDINSIQDKIVENIKNFPIDFDIALDIISSYEEYTYVDAFDTIFSYLNQGEVEDILYDTEYEDILSYSDIYGEESFYDLNSDEYLSPMQEGFTKRSRIIQALEERNQSFKGFFTGLEKLKTFFEESSDEELVKFYENYMSGSYEYFLEEKSLDEMMEDHEDDEDYYDLSDNDEEF